MPRTFHLAALSLGLIWLTVAISARLNGPEPKVELLSYLALGVGLFELISIVRKGLNRATPTRFTGAMVILVFCIWTGGTPFAGAGGLRNAGILFMVWLVCYLASWRAIRGAAEFRKVTSKSG